MRDPQAKSLENAIMGSPLLRPVLQSWRQINLPNSWLVAGAIAQTLFWNHRHGLPSEFGIGDIDLIYHDANDLSEEAEARNSQRICQLFRAVPVHFDVKNEARVHLWYEAKFGHAIAPSA